VIPEDKQMGNPEALFNGISHELKSGSQNRVSIAMDDLTIELRSIRNSVSKENWKSTINIGRSHELRGLVHQDPFTKWSFEQPFGYPGDAKLIDFIYGTGDFYGTKLQRSTPLGRAIFSRNRMVPACRAVRYRKDFISEKMGSVLKSKNNARILSVASGHLREAERIHWAGIDNLEAFFVLDQDSNSLNVIKNSKYHNRVFPTVGSVRTIITCRFEEHGFDLIYALGLYDYLTNRTAVMLHASLFDRLRSGGELIVANFVKNLEDVGYMETFMDWSLIYRDVNDMLKLTEKIPENLIDKIEHFIDPAGQIIFLSLTRK